LSRRMVTRSSKTRSSESCSNMLCGRSSTGSPIRTHRLGR
jgi:hypothetical protein